MFKYYFFEFEIKTSKGFIPSLLKSSKYVIRKHRQQIVGIIKKNEGILIQFHNLLDIIFFLFFYFSFRNCNTVIHKEKVLLPATGFCAPLPHPALHSAGPTGVLQKAALPQSL